MQAQAAGYRWLALEYDDFGNASVWATFRQQCHAVGLLAGVWFTGGVNVGFAPADADFVIAEDEDEGDRSGILAALALGLIDLSKPHAIVGNGWMRLNPDGTGDRPGTLAQMKPIVDAGFFFLGELYYYTDAGQPTGLDWPNVVFNAVANLGFDEDVVQPVFGAFGGPYTYDPLKEGNPGWSDWTVETRLQNA